MREVIPVMHCFDKNYVIPVAVSFYSMLSNASKEYDYVFYVLHSDIHIELQKRLEITISSFNNARLVFIDTKDFFVDIFEKLPNKAHYSKEMFFKLFTPEFFPDINRLIITDVDVVFLGDISSTYCAGNNTEYYVEGCKGLVRKGSEIEKFMSVYDNNFTASEIEICKGVGAGYVIFNLELMRKDNIVEQFLNCTLSNIERLIQPEQDVMNLVCYPKIKCLPANTMICSYSYAMYSEYSGIDEDINFSSEEVKFALQNPIQLHYAGPAKPWNRPHSALSLIWYQYLFKTPFADDFLRIMDEKFRS